MVTTDELRRLPKAVLHDHIDGGLRMATIIDLAQEYGYRDLPTTDPDDLAAWFDQRASGSLERYLTAFVHTIGVMQHSDAIERVAFESVEDLATDGAIYAELRGAPSLFCSGRLSLPDAFEAILAGLLRGERETGTITRFIAVALRDQTDSETVARTSIRYTDEGLVGFDLAGPEAGFPPDDHLAACRVIREANLGLTAHAGEADGPDSIWRALQRCGAHRIGHGVHIIDDCTVIDGDIVEIGPIAAYVRNVQVPLEVCPTSNLQTIGWKPEEHPVGALHRAGFNVTISPDNRLMSQTSMSDEFALLAHHHGFGISDFHAVTWRAVDAAFSDWDTKQKILARVDAGYIAAQAD
jgi:adenosine deaminase